MKQFLFVFSLLALFIVGCSSDPTSDNLVQEGEMLAQDIPDTCHCDSMTMNKAGEYLKDDEPYSGVCVLNYPNSEEKYVSKSFFKGNLHGDITYYDQRGDVLMTETYDMGSLKRAPNGAPLRCECSELTKEKPTGNGVVVAYLDGIPFTGSCTEYYPDSKIKYTEVNYEGGVQDGFATYFDRQGKTMFMEKYDQGNLIKTIQGK